MKCRNGKYLLVIPAIVPLVALAITGFAMKFIGEKVSAYSMIAVNNIGHWVEGDQ